MPQKLDIRLNYVQYNIYQLHNIKITSYLFAHIISLLSVIHTIYSIMQTKIQGPCILVCIILYMVCMTDNKLIICVNRNTPG